MKRKRKLGEDDVGEIPSTLQMDEGSGGHGIHRKNPHRRDFDYGSEYRSKVYLCLFLKIANKIWALRAIFRNNNIFAIILC